MSRAVDARLTSAQEVGGLARSGTVAHVRELKARKSLTRQGLAARGVWVTTLNREPSCDSPQPRPLRRRKRRRQVTIDACTGQRLLVDSLHARQTVFHDLYTVNRAQQILQQTTGNKSTPEHTAEALQAQIKCKSTRPLICLARLQDPTLFEPAAVISRASF